MTEALPKWNRICYLWTVMKRLMILLTLCLLLPLPQEAAAKDTGRAMVRLVKEYRHEEGFEVVDLGKIALSVMRAAAKPKAKTKGEKETLAAFAGITQLVVGDCSKCPEKVRNAFTARVEKLLRHEEPLLEAKDQGNLLRIYASVSPDAEELRDVIIFNTGDGSVVCAFGTVPMSFLHRIARHK